MPVIIFFPLCFVWCHLAGEESEAERVRMETEEERDHQQRADFRKLEPGRRRRGAWGKRKHAATVESAAYRIV